MAQYVSVILPVPIAGTFTYEVPQGMVLQPGSRVIVQFGKKKSYTGIVEGVAPSPQGYEAKKIIEKLDGAPMVRHPQLKFWHWLADYYMCTPGEVYRAALPTGLKIESETFLMPSPDWEEDINDRLGEAEVKVMDVVLASTKSLTPAQIAKKSELPQIEKTVARLVERRALAISEKLVEKYRSRNETFLNLKNVDLQQAFNLVSGAPKQEKALVAFLDLSSQGQNDVAKNQLIARADVNQAIVKALIEKGILSCYKKEINRFSFSGLVSGQLPQLTQPQTSALKEIHKQWHNHDVVLLHGVTSSGKTEIYQHLAHAALNEGRQVLYLVPEIALTTQLTHRLQRVFGDKVLIYHSRFSDNERVDLYKKVLSDNKPRIIIGARSSVFLPFSSLGLIIVDEEHESSYKQQDPAPRYNARDAAVMLAHMHGAKTLLGSATPSIETYYKAQEGKYGLVTLSERYENLPLPKIEIIDMLKERKKQHFSGTFSLPLRSLINQNLRDGKQAILFLNRRGYAPFAVCKQCGYVPKCVNCDVSLTYHRHIDKLVCHYCGTPYELPRQCPACQEPGLEVVGYGTERVEDEVKNLFPDAKLARLDLDTTRNKDAYENIIDGFSKGKTQILVGTQMVTKGLDFDNVGIVGVVNADAVINFPDFRANERAFNMIEQVAGRAGRKNGQGLVAVQTRTPSHPLFPFLTSHDYTGFYNHELKEREHFYYPPFSRIIYIYLKHKDRSVLTQMANNYYAKLQELLGNRVSPPDEPSVARVQTLYIRRIMVKIEQAVSVTKVKELLKKVRIDMVNSHSLPGAILYYDVDPF